MSAEMDELSKGVREKFFMRVPMAIQGVEYFKLDPFQKMQMQDMLVANAIRSFEAAVQLQHTERVLATPRDTAKALLPRWMQRGRLKPRWRTKRFRVVRVLATDRLEMVID